MWGWGGRGDPADCSGPNTQGGAEEIRYTRILRGVLDVPYYPNEEMRLNGDGVMGRENRLVRSDGWRLTPW